MFEVLVTCGKHACYTKKHGCSRRGRLLAISRSFKFTFVFHYKHMLVFFHTDVIQINWKSTPWNRKFSRLLSEKDRQVIKTTPARSWSRARQRLVETDHISILPYKQSCLLRKRTKWEWLKLAKLPKQPKQNHWCDWKKRRTKCLGNVDFTSHIIISLAIWILPK